MKRSFVCRARLVRVLLSFLVMTATVVIVRYHYHYYRQNDLLHAAGDAWAASQQPGIMVDSSFANKKRLTLGDPIAKGSHTSEATSTMLTDPSRQEMQPSPPGTLSNNGTIRTLNEIQNKATQTASSREALQNEMLAEVQNRSRLQWEQDMRQTKQEDDPDDPFPCPLDLSYTIGGVRVSKCRPGKISSPLVIDIISIGSKHRLHYLEGQYSTWASHPSVRNFVGVTEEDDADPQCEMKMTAGKLRQHHEKCRKRHKSRLLMKYQYMPLSFLTQKTNPFGWLCAQVRPGTGLGKIARYYKSLLLGSDDDGENALPDYLLLVDDDTMIRMDTFEQEMKAYNSSMPRVWAGCVTLKSRPNQNWYRFSPFGGAGTYFSKGALRRLLTPLHCSKYSANATAITTIELATTTSDDAYTQFLCERIQQNKYFESPFKEEGQTLAEHARMYFNRWRNCFVSDWLVGHYVNYFRLGDVWDDDVNHKTNAESRLHPYQRSFIFQDGKSTFEKPGRGCDCNDGCLDPTLPICHYVNPDKMRNFTSQWMSLEESSLKQSHETLLLPSSVVHDSTKILIQNNTSENTSSIESRKASQLKWKEDILQKKRNDPNDPFPCPLDLSYNIGGVRVSKCRRKGYHGDVNASLIIDIVSIGSKHRIDYLKGQYSTWASHSSVRNFIGITEEDDVNPYCELNLTSSKISQHVLRQHHRICVKRHSKDRLKMYQYMPLSFLLRKTNGFGWLCAQVRPGTGLGKMARYYKMLLKSSSSPDADEALPDYMLLVDDDTMIRMDVFEEEMKAYDSSIPRVWAGCVTLKAFPGKDLYRFSPNGGAGTYFSKGALRRLLTPLHCSKYSDSATPSAQIEAATTKDAYTQFLCERIHENQFFELPFREEGLTLAEHAAAYFNRWRNCFVSDWLVGHYVNYFRLGDVWDDGVIDKTKAESRLHPYQRSFAFQDGVQNRLSNVTFENPGRGCRCNDGCLDSSLPICHYVDPGKMRNFTSQWMSLEEDKVEYPQSWCGISDCPSLEADFKRLSKVPSNE